MFDDTIAAISTPVGEGGIGIVRLSGPQAEKIALSNFTFFRLPSKIVSHHLYYGWVKNPRTGELVDEALLVFMKAPRTYTREDVVEINCHGGIVPLAKTLELILAAGARLAEPGEFTRRAFLNGRIDLSQAEGIIQIIRARTETALRLGMAQLSGLLGEKVRGIRGKLLSVLAHLEASIDYPEHHDVDDMARNRIEESVTSAAKEISELLATAERGRILREGVRTAIIGKPNVGKSSLLNALLREQRAIVTAVPGTTRDILEENVNLGGIALTLMDTAGIRETADEVEKIGVQRTRLVMEEADLLLYVVEISEELSEEDKEILQSIKGKPCIVIANKTDLLPIPRQTAELLEKQVAPHPVVMMSMTLLQGMEQLEKKIIETVYQGEVNPPQSAMVTTIRQKDILSRALYSLKELEVALSEGYAEDILAIDLHSALDILGEITGESVSADLSEEIFSSFCIGK